MATCRDCAHYDIEAFRIANGDIRISKGKTAGCMFDMERIIRKFPASLPERSIVRLLSWMAPNEGNGCPQWTDRAAIAKTKGE